LKPGARKQSLKHLLLEKEALRTGEFDNAGNFTLLAGMNQVLLLADDQLREVARFGGKLDELVHPQVQVALRKKFG